MTVFKPAVVKVNGKVATPLAICTTTEPMSALVKVTVPVKVPDAGGCTVTLAVKSVISPIFGDVAEEVNEVFVVPGLTTWGLLLKEAVAGRLLTSPLYAAVMV